MVLVSQTRKKLQKQEQYIYKYTIEMEIVDVSSFRMDWHLESRLAYG